jgi:hypothetical protein
MKKLLTIVLAAASLTGGVYLVEHYELSGLMDGRLVPRGKATAPAPAEPKKAAAPKRSTLRIATFNLGKFTDNSLGNSRTRELVSQVIGRFDVIALQGIHAQNHGLVVRLLEQVNAAHRDYDYAVEMDPSSNRTESYNAFVFDRATIEIDRSTVYSMEDPSGHLNRRPLVATFRARGASPSEAFTFTLINVYVDTENAGDELDVLESVYDAASKRRQDEDDLILLGTLRADGKKLAWLEKRFRLAGVITNVPTTTRGTQIADNIVLPRPAVVEYTGRSGVLDLLSEFGLSMQETLEVSENLPVWAEFSVYEGGQPGQVPSGVSR